jgi:hypothetical protein
MRGEIQVVNPSKKWFSWSGSTGTLSYYDKESKQNIEVKTPFTFLLLDTFTTIKGYSNDAKAGIYANEIKDTTKEILNVRVGKEDLVKGIYKDIKEKIVAAGGKYAQSCYIAYKEANGELTIGNIMMEGSSFGGGTHIPADKNMKDVKIGAWMDFSKNNQAVIETKAIVLEGRDERICTNGATKFYAPKFKIIEVDPETDKQAIALTQVLKQYMTEYFKKSAFQTEIATYPETEEELAQRVEQANTAVHSTSEEPKMSNHEALFGTPDERETHVPNEPVDDLPF